MKSRSYSSTKIDFRERHTTFLVLENCPKYLQWKFYNVHLAPNHRRTCPECLTREIQQLRPRDRVHMHCIAARGSHSALMLWMERNPVVQGVCARSKPVATLQCIPTLWHSMHGSPTEKTCRSSGHEIRCTWCISDPIYSLLLLSVILNQHAHRK